MVKSPFSSPKSLVSLVKHHFCYLNVPFWSHEPGPFLVTEVVPKNRPPAAKGGLTTWQSPADFTGKHKNSTWFDLENGEYFQVSHFSKFLAFAGFSLFQVSHCSIVLSFWGVLQGWSTYFPPAESSQKCPMEWNLSPFSGWLAGSHIVTTTSNHSSNP